MLLIPVPCVGAAFLIPFLLGSSGYSEYFVTAVTLIFVMPVFLTAVHVAVGSPAIRHWVNHVAGLPEHPPKTLSPEQRKRV